MNKDEFDVAVAADTTDPVRAVPVPLLPAVDTEGELLAVFLAGAALTYAIYHSGSEAVKSLPDPVLRAYARACTVFDPGGRKSTSE